MNNNSDNKIIKTSNYDNMLIIVNKSLFGRKKFIVCDNYKNKLYKITVTDKEALLLFNNKEIGKIIYNRNNNQVSYSVFLDKMKSGEIEKNVSVKPIYEMPSNNLRIEGNLLHDQYKVFDNYNTNIIIINLTKEGKYIISFNNQSNEKIALIIAMMIELENKN